MSSSHRRLQRSCQPSIVPGEAGLSARNSEAGEQFVDEKAAAWLVGLEPFAVNDELRDRALADVLDDRGRGGRVGVDIDLGVGDAVRFEKLLGGAAIAAPGGGVNLHVHKQMLLKLRCYDL